MRHALAFMLSTVLRDSSISGVVPSKTPTRWNRQCLQADRGRDRGHSRATPPARVSPEWGWRALADTLVELIMPRVAGVLVDEGFVLGGAYVPKRRMKRGVCDHPSIQSKTARRRPTMVGQGWGSMSSLLIEAKELSHRVVPARPLTTQ